MAIYLDVTDVISYAEGNSRVSGIQRVQMRIISELVALHDASEVRVVYFDKLAKAHLQIDPGAVFGPLGAEFDANRIIRSLNLHKGRILPEKHQIRHHLKPYDHNKVVRGLVKVKLYAQALLQPDVLIAQGFHDWRKQDGGYGAASKSAMRLTPADHFVLLGAFWTFEDVIAAARAHRAQGGKVTVLVHDVIPKVVPQYCSKGQTQHFWPQFRQVADYANRFLAVSRHTADDFRRCMQAEGRQVEVQTLPLAHEFGMVPRSNTAPQAKPGATPYVLCVGTIEIRKNGVLLLLAWQELIKRYGAATPELVFCGKYGWKIRDFKRLLGSDAALRAKVRIIASPSDAKLTELYQNALFSVFPSHYEGWGLPVGECAWLGKYCLASSSSSIPEVLGDLIDYASPDAPHDWADKVATMLDQPQALLEKEARIRQAPLRRWRDVAQDLHDKVTSNP